MTGMPKILSSQNVLYLAKSRTTNQTNAESNEAMQKEN